MSRACLLSAMCDVETTTAAHHRPPSVEDDPGLSSSSLDAHSQALDDTEASSAPKSIHQRFIDAQRRRHLSHRDVARPCQGPLTVQTTPWQASYPPLSPGPSDLRQLSQGDRPQRSSTLTNCDPEVMIKQPETRPISQEQLIAEVKGIYAGLVMVESKCIEVDNAQSSNKDTKLSNEQWQALIALHRTLLHEHHDFFLASPVSPVSSTRPGLRKLVARGLSLAKIASGCHLRNRRRLTLELTWLNTLLLSTSTLDALSQYEKNFEYIIELEDLFDQIEVLLRRLTAWFMAKFHELGYSRILRDLLTEFPHNMRHLCTTMPWTIWPALVVLWGVCWMFAVYDNRLGQEMPDAQVPSALPQVSPTVQAPMNGEQEGLDQFFQMHTSSSQPSPTAWAPLEGDQEHTEITRHALHWDLVDNEPYPNHMYALPYDWNSAFPSWKENDPMPGHEPSVVDCLMNDEAKVPHVSDDFVFLATRQLHATLPLDPRSPEHAFSFGLSSASPETDPGGQSQQAPEDTSPSKGASSNVSSSKASGRENQSVNRRSVFTCPVPSCGKTFTRRTTLRRHQQSKHQDVVNRAACPHCNKSYPRKDHLQRHMAARHQRERQGSTSAGSNTEHEDVAGVSNTESQISIAEAQPVAEAEGPPSRPREPLLQDDGPLDDRRITEGLKQKYRSLLAVVETKEEECRRDRKVLTTLRECLKALGEEME